MALNASVLTTMQEWVDQQAALGRVTGGIRMPDTVSGLFAGQLASRLAVPDPSLGAGPLQWDYQLAPLMVRVADNWQSTTDELNQALMAYSQNVLGFVSDVAGATGAVTHYAVQTVAEATAAAIGIPTWLLWGGVAFGAYYVVTHVGETKRYARQWIS